MGPEAPDWMGQIEETAPETALWSEEETGAGGIAAPR